MGRQKRLAFRANLLRQKGFGSILALCLTEAAQTYHHWKVFTHGASGACIFFNNEKLLAWLSEDDLIKGRKVIYRTLWQIQKEPPTVDDLPFLKRKAYEHEAEFRLLCPRKSKSVQFKNFVFPINIIDGVYLNPWLPIATFNAVKNVIHKIEGCEELDVMRATITANDEWQKVATNTANV